MEANDKRAVNCGVPVVCCGSSRHMPPPSLPPPSLPKDRSRVPKKHTYYTPSRYLSFMMKDDKSEEKRRIKKANKVQAVIEREMEMWRGYQQWNHRVKKIPVGETVPVRAGDFVVPVRVPVPPPPCSSSSSSSSDALRTLKWSEEQYEQVLSRGYGTPQCTLRCVKRRRTRRLRRLQNRRLLTPSGRIYSPDDLLLASLQVIPAFSIRGFDGPEFVKPRFWSPSVSSINTIKEPSSTSLDSSSEDLLQSSIGSCTSLLSKRSVESIGDDEEADPVRRGIQLWPGEEELKQLYEDHYIEKEVDKEKKNKENPPKQPQEEEKGAESVAPISIKSNLSLVKLPQTPLAPAPEETKVYQPFRDDDRKGKETSIAKKNGRAKAKDSKSQKTDNNNSNKNSRTTSKDQESQKSDIPKKESSTKSKKGKKGGSGGEERGKNRSGGDSGVSFPSTSHDTIVDLPGDRAKSAKASAEKSASEAAVPTDAMDYNSQTVSQSVTPSEECKSSTQTDRAALEKEADAGEARVLELATESDASVDTHISDSSGARHRLPPPPVPENCRFWERNAQPSHYGYSSSTSCGSEMDRLSIALSDSPEAKAADHTRGQQTPPLYHDGVGKRAKERDRDSDASRLPAPQTLLADITEEYRAQIKRLHAIRHDKSPELLSVPRHLSDTTAAQLVPGAPGAPANSGDGTSFAGTEAWRANKAMEQEAHIFYLEEEVKRSIGPNSRVYIDIFQGEKNVILLTVSGDLLVVDVNIAKQLDLYKMQMNSMGEQNFVKEGGKLPSVGLKNSILVLLWSSHFQTYDMAVHDDTQSVSSLSSTEDDNISEMDVSDLWSDPEEPSLPPPSEGTISSSEEDLTSRAKGKRRLKKTKSGKNKRKKHVHTQKVKSSLKSPGESIADVSAARMSHHSNSGSALKVNQLRSSTVTKVAGPEGLPVDNELDPSAVALLHALVGSGVLCALRNLAQTAEAVGAEALRLALLRVVARSVIGATGENIKALLDAGVQGVSQPFLFRALSAQMPITDHYIVPYMECFRDENTVSSDLLTLPRKTQKRNKRPAVPRETGTQAAVPKEGNPSRISKQQRNVGQKQGKVSRSQKGQK